MSLLVRYCIALHTELLFQIQHGTVFKQNNAFYVAIDAHTNCQFLCIITAYIRKSICHYTSDAWSQSSILYYPIIKPHFGKFLCPAWLKSAGHIVFALSVRLSVSPSVRPSVRPCARPTFCRHYSSETIRRSILIFIHVIPNILKLCTLVSVCPSVRLFGQN